MDPNLEAARRGGGVNSALPTIQQIYHVGPTNIKIEADREPLIDLVMCSHFCRNLDEDWMYDNMVSRI
jgi:hypothetical protein